ncbi:hypothetical protein A3Q56_07182 [Intoshia linei]|uniref:Mediator of RNA polymerase II transcription subunit 10 n=1 Tax=Intoshia linei TaxID=1819745 RepID=A0A177ASU5_9BILA|nr:hypothetical protein A3Q56_07182 [Intoshia linei]
MVTNLRNFRNKLIHELKEVFPHEMDKYASLNKIEDLIKNN